MVDSGSMNVMGQCVANEKFMEQLELLDFPMESVEDACEEEEGEDWNEKLETALGPIPGYLFGNVSSSLVLNGSETVTASSLDEEASSTNKPKSAQPLSPNSVLESNSRIPKCITKRARSKRSRLNEKWISFKLQKDIFIKKKRKTVEKKSSPPSVLGSAESALSKSCSHCQVTHTPQWREGPMGPKTLCNACGVRYRSGRLFPEYRPMASPTFVPDIHSNSHRKVLEMRKKEDVILDIGSPILPLHVKKEGQKEKRTRRVYPALAAGEPEGQKKESSIRVYPELAAGDPEGQKGKRTRRVYPKLAAGEPEGQKKKRIRRVYPKLAAGDPEGQKEKRSRRVYPKLAAGEPEGQKKKRIRKVYPELAAGDLEGQKNKRIKKVYPKLAAGNPEGQKEKRTRRVYPKLAVREPEGQKKKRIQKVYLELAAGDLEGQKKKRTRKVYPKLAAGEQEGQKKKRTRKVYPELAAEDPVFSVFERSKNVIVEKKATPPLGSAENVLSKRCSHCQVIHTPQWREGPICPKPICNACWARKHSVYPKQAAEEFDPVFSVLDHSMNVIVEKKATTPSVSSENVLSKSCSHCWVTHTPLCRDGPMGWKTLCNACGIRHRTGRLLPVYPELVAEEFHPVLSVLNCSKNVIMEEKKATPASGSAENALSKRCSLASGRLLPVYPEPAAGEFHPVLSVLDRSENVIVEKKTTPASGSAENALSKKCSPASGRLLPVYPEPAAGEFHPVLSVLNCSKNVIMEKKATPASDSADNALSKRCSPASGRLLPVCPEPAAGVFHPVLSVLDRSKNVIVEKKATPALGSTENALSKRCSHCQVTHTPQWREGPMGPSTLCNACGVRYRSGRLFPEYRPMASPTFIPDIHSNSHRKVLEMRKERM